MIHVYILDPECYFNIGFGFDLNRAIFAKPNGYIDGVSILPYQFGFGLFLNHCQGKYPFLTYF